jgi:DNA-binding IscR family transcriptional regulator
MPLPYLSKIFQRLGEAGIVETKRGYKGGVKLARPPAEISLLAIDAAVENSRQRTRLRPGGRFSSTQHVLAGIS